MTLNELRYIVAVARERHFGRAAAACFISQPTLSVAVRKLEEKLGVVLFERGTGDVLVTPVGERVVEQARRVLDEAAAIPYLASQSQDELSGVLRLGAIYTIGPYLLPHLIPRLRSDAPRMPVQIEENFTAVLSRQLAQGDLDVVILSLPFAEPGIETESLYEEPFVVVMPRGHPLEQETAVSTARLAQEELLLLGPGHCFREQVLLVCPECRRGGLAADSLQRTLEGGSLETIRLMVASGMGVTVLPQSSVNQYPTPAAWLSVRPFAPPAPKRVVALAWRSRFPRPLAIRTLAAAVRTCPLEEAVTFLPAAGE
jgi:LysR family hydrogen peroxide-inducible transcriptional activator